VNWKAPLFGLTVVALLVFAAPAAAQTFTVTNTSDSGVLGDGSLRGEIRAANAAAGPDAVAFAPGLSGTITLGVSGLVVQGPTTVEGPGPAVLTVNQTAGGHRVLQVNLTEPGTVSVSGLTLSGGETTGPGGDLEYDEEGEAATLIVSDCVITEGTAEDYGGGIASFGAPLTLRGSVVTENAADSGGGIWTGGHDMPFTIEDSTISGNESVGAGGGLNGEVEGGGHDSIVGSTIAGNRSEDNGGGGYFSLGDETSITVANSTVTENISEGDGGGFEFNTGEAVQAIVEDSTIAGNHGGSLLGEAGGVQAFGATPQTLVDTIVADNTGGQPDIYGPWAAAFSLIGDPTGGKLAESVPGSDLIGLDPQLGPLADNGGPTETMAPAPTSPVVNKGGGAISTDQRGDLRPVLYPGVGLSTAAGANGADIGAYELAAPPASVGNTSPPPGESRPLPLGKKAAGPPRVRVSCPKSAAPTGCHFALQVFSAKPHGGKGKRVHSVKPVAESLVTTANLRPGKSAEPTLTPKPKFAAKLDAARSLLVREAATIGGRRTVSYRRMKVVG
jgi:hypothetical protein